MQQLQILTDSLTYNEQSGGNTVMCSTDFVSYVSIACKHSKSNWESDYKYRDISSGYYHCSKPKVRLGQVQTRQLAKLQRIY